MNDINKFRKNLLSYNKPYKVQFGSGNKPLKNWINSDSNGPFKWIISGDPLPFKDNSCTLIYHEHLLEHLPVPIALNFLRESYRILKPGGILRIAQPDLDDIVEAAYKGTFKKYPSAKNITKAELLNMAFNGWGHKHLYNAEELTSFLVESGFEESKIKYCKFGESTTPELRNLETRQESLLLGEATK